MAAKFPVSNASTLSFVLTEPNAQDVTLLRLYLLRVGYLILIVGLGLVIWPAVFQHSPEVALRSGPRLSLLAAMGALSLLGLRYPVRMIPLLLFEVAWKAIYLCAFAFPLWRHHQLTPAAVEDITACALVVLFLPLIPWRFVFDHYIEAKGQRWR